MLTVRTRVLVREDGTIEAKAPGELPPGEHEAVIVVEAERPEPRFRWEEFPVHEGEWDHTVSLRREDIYGDDAR